MLRSGKVVVTDRLHGALLARMAGRPAVLVDNCYGKNSALHATWLGWDKDLHLVGSRKDGLRCAVGLSTEFTKPDIST